MEEVNIACYLVNKSASTTIDSKTPQEVWFGKRSNYSYLLMFGCIDYACVNDRKLDLRARKYIFLRYASGGKDHRLWCSEEAKIQNSLLAEI